MDTHSRKKKKCNDEPEVMIEFKNASFKASVEDNAPTVLKDINLKVRFHSIAGQPVICFGY